jgi:hypothetical protein
MKSRTKKRPKIKLIDEFTKAQLSLDDIDFDDKPNNDDDDIFTKYLNSCEDTSIADKWLNKK